VICGTLRLQLNYERFFLEMQLLRARDCSRVTLMSSFCFLKTFFPFSSFLSPIFHMFFSFSLFFFSTGNLTCQPVCVRTQVRWNGQQRLSALYKRNHSTNELSHSERRGQYPQKKHFSYFLRLSLHVETVTNVNVKAANRLRFHESVLLLDM
jgi:hypothetical protein